VEGYDPLMEEDGSGKQHAFLREGGKDLSAHQSVRRPPASPLNPKTDDFIFMQIDTDYYTSIPPGKIATKEKELTHVNMVVLTTLLVFNFRLHKKRGQP
jgi:hypothetical protein